MVVQNQKVCQKCSLGKVEIMKRRAEMDEETRKEAIDRAHRKEELAKMRDKKIKATVKKNMKKNKGVMTKKVIRKVNKAHRVATKKIDHSRKT